jgi:hypothetical protein
MDDFPWPPLSPQELEEYQPVFKHLGITDPEEQQDVGRRLWLAIGSYQNCRSFDAELDAPESGSGSPTRNVARTN